MNTDRQFFLVILFLIFCSTVFAQNNSFGLLPALNINKKLSKAYRLNLKSESRQSLYQDDEFNLQYDLVDFSLMASRKIDLNQSLATGYLIRFRENVVAHRSIQQWVIVQNLDGLRLGHRLSSDQTFQDDQDTEYRFRYRLSSQISLNGQSVDTKEFYLKINNEYLNAFQGEDYDLEIRLVAALGYEFNDNNKLEFGLDNRWDSFIDGELRNRSWLSLVWYIGF